MTWDLPVSVNIDGKEYRIRNNCDYRVVLDVMAAITDTSMEKENRLECALLIFYENLAGCENMDVAISEMMRIINNGDDDKDDSQEAPVMDWAHDFKIIAPPVSRILGRDIRAAESYTHWWTFLGAFQEIGESVFANVVSIRRKKQKGKKLEKWEIEFYRENKKMIDLPLKLSDEEIKRLNADW